MVMGTDNLHSDQVEAGAKAESSHPCWAVLELCSLLTVLCCWTVALESGKQVWRPHFTRVRLGGGGTYEDWYHKEDSTRC